VVPTIGDLAITRIDNGVPADWGVYVQGYSTAQVQITGAAGAYGSTIRSYAINSSGFSASGQTATIGPITLSGAVDIWGTVIDSRLRSAVMTKTIQVVPYSKPWFTSTPGVMRYVPAHVFLSLTAQSHAAVMAIYSPLASSSPLALLRMTAGVLDYAVRCGGHLGNGHRFPPAVCCDDQDHTGGAR